MAFWRGRTFITRSVVDERTNKRTNEWKKGRKKKREREREKERHKHNNAINFQTSESVGGLNLNHWNKMLGRWWWQHNTFFYVMVNNNWSTSKIYSSSLNSSQNLIESWMLHSFLFIPLSLIHLKVEMERDGTTMMNVRIVKERANMLHLLIVINIDPLKWLWCVIVSLYNFPTCKHINKIRNTTIPIRGKESSHEICHWNDCYI